MSCAFNGSIATIWRREMVGMRELLAQQGREVESFKPTVVDEGASLSCGLVVLESMYEWAEGRDVLARAGQRAIVVLQIR